MIAPDFVVLGAQRAGSTQVSAWLAAHPDIHLCGDEVPYYEDPFFANSDPAELAAALETSNGEAVRGIHCPSYLGHPEVPSRLAADNPDMRIIVVVRDPIARAVSTYFWYVQFGMFPLVPVDDGLRMLLDGWSDPTYPHAHEVLDWGRYAHHLRAVDARFPASQIAVRLLDDLAGHDAVAELVSFVGADPAATPAVGPTRSNAGVYHPARLRWLQRRNRFVWSWEDASTYRYRPRRRRRPLAMIPNLFIVGVDRGVLRPVLGNARPELSDAAHAALVDYYRDDVGDLEGRLGRRLDGWLA